MTYVRTIAIATIMAISCFPNPSNAFSVVPSKLPVKQETTSTSINMFGNALKGAFANDDSLGKAKNAGLSGVS